jgi:hypothetical protein
MNGVEAQMTYYSPPPELKEGCRSALDRHLSFNVCPLSRDAPCLHLQTFL